MAHPVGEINTTTMSDIHLYGLNCKKKQKKTHACVQRTMFLFFLPGYVGARFDSLPLYISCYRWTCNLS